MMNLKPNFRLILRIETPDGVFPVETDQYVDFADVKRVAEGRTVDVKFDPKVRDRVNLCSRDIESADVPFDDRSEAKFMAAGRCVPAEILSVSQIPQVSVMLSASVGTRPLAAGMKIQVWIDPNSRDRLELQLSDIVA